MATMDVPPSATSPRSYGAFATENTAAGQPGGGGGQLQRVDAYGEGPGGLQYTQASGEVAKQAIAGALAGYGESAGGMIGAQRASQGMGRNSDAFLPGVPQM